MMRRFATRPQVGRIALHIRRFYINTSAIQYAKEATDKVEIYFNGDKTLTISLEEWQTIADSFLSVVTPPAGTA